MVLVNSFGLSVGCYGWGGVGWGGVGWVPNDYYVQPQPELSWSSGWLLTILTSASADML